MYPHGGIKAHYEDARFMKTTPNFHEGLIPKCLAAGFSPIHPMRDSWKKLYIVNGMKPPMTIDWKTSSCEDQGRGS